MIPPCHTWGIEIFKIISFFIIYIIVYPYHEKRAISMCGTVAVFLLDGRILFNPSQLLCQLLCKSTCCAVYNMTPANTPCLQMGYNKITVELGVIHYLCLAFYVISCPNYHQSLRNISYCNSIGDSPRSNRTQRCPI